MRHIAGIVLIVAVALAGGCSPQAAFKPETFRVGASEITIKGWTKDGQLCVEIELFGDDKAVSLHSVALVNAADEKLAPHRTVNKTPKAPKMSVGAAMGIPVGHGRHYAQHGGRGGWGPTIAPGAGIPPGGDGNSGRVTAVEACWILLEGYLPVTACALEVNLLAVRQDRIDLTTIPLTLTAVSAKDGGEHSTPPPADEEPKDDDDDAKKLVQEIDFTLKAPPTTRTLKV